MSRIIAVNLLLLLLPSIVYFVFIIARDRQLPSDETLRKTPIVWLMGLGAFLMFTTLIIAGVWETGPTEGRYVPPKVVDGVIIPGHVEPNK